MAPMDSPETGNEENRGRLIIQERDEAFEELADRVETLEHVVVAMMALAVRKDSELRPAIYKDLMKLIRDIDKDPENNMTPDREYRAKTDLGQTIEFIKDTFMDKA
ncbi:hypothetical protein [Paracoccus methylarcula]|uniref:Uncharacterized protein n=1 Tax=Paracoccus methylarcula TaxID=72022 RepID=A0A422QYJ0_9RHOB|nr:hypothetical protein [Paracoccus methylarcula]RNF35067.1 hypothetical protein A7A09_008885 [Paracoccus methylarcula]